MNEATQPPVSKRSELVRFFHWLFSWRGLRRILIVLAWTATIIALIYGEENWRGRRAWNQSRQELEARGEVLDFAAFIPKPVPDDQNFAATPFIQSWFSERTNLDKRWEDDLSRANAAVAGLAKADKGRRRLIDLGGWELALNAVRSRKLEPGERFKSDKFDPASRAKAAPAVLEGLKTSEPNLAELSLASRRPSARYPVVYELENPWGILIPHLANVKSACSRLQLRACAELAAGQSEKALDDVRLMLYLVDSVKDDPILISFLTRLACLQMAIQPMWEGLPEHRWSEAQLQELQSRFQRYNLMADLRQPLSAERAVGILTVDLLYRQKYRLSTLIEPPGSTPPGWTLLDLVARIAPRGWYYQEQVNYCRLYEQEMRGTFDDKVKRVSPRQIESNSHELERWISAGRGFGAIIHHRLIAWYLLPALGKIPLKAAMAQTAADQAALACALERYRLANGQFPEKLDALVPRFVAQVPNDVFTGEPYKYHFNEEKNFVLYSVGWNERNDGGAPGKTLYDEKEGDWVW